MAEPKHHTMGAGGDAAHAHGVGRYAFILLLLLALTGLTIWTGRMDLGVANIFIALAIATTKATLVVLFFMHLWEASGVIRLVFVVSVLFVAVLLLGVFGDLLTRMPVTLPHGGPMPDVPHGSSAPPPAH